MVGCILEIWGKWMKEDLCGHFLIIILLEIMPCHNIKFGKVIGKNLLDFLIG